MTSIPDRLVIATRGSRLALRQAEIVRDLVAGAHPGVEVELSVVSTRGDRDRRPFSSIGGKGIFVAEVEHAVAAGAADVAVHSAKDLTAELAEGCAIVCVPERASPADIVVGGEGASGLERLGSLGPGATIGTSSMRRRSLLAEARSDLETVELRGNLDTRLRKVATGEIDAAVLARAGLERLPLEDPVAFGELDPGWWVPAPGQGALAVEARSDRADLALLFEPLDDPAARAELECERAFARTLEGGCSIPLGCLARADGDSLVATGFLGDPEGGQSFRDRISGGVAEAAAVGEELARAILAGGGDDLRASIEALEVPEPP